MSASKKTRTGAVVAATPSARAFALSPGSLGARAAITSAPAARATSAVSSLDPSSTTQTTPAPGAARAARTTAPTVDPSSRAGITTSYMEAASASDRRVPNGGAQRFFPCPEQRSDQLQGLGLGRRDAIGTLKEAGERLLPLVGKQGNPEGPATASLDGDVAILEAHVEPGREVGRSAVSRQVEVELRLRDLSFEEGC